jgi:hypothetical protein
MQKILIFFVLVFTESFMAAQNFPEPQMMRKFKSDTLVLDEQNGDGAFKLRHKRSQKWGLYQWLYRGLMTRELIPMAYDSLEFIGINRPFAVVYQKGKHGVYLSGWNYENARESVPCIYEDSKIVIDGNRICLAVKEAGQWFWMNWETGQEFRGQMASNPDQLSDCPVID